MKADPTKVWGKRGKNKMTPSHPCKGGQAKFEFQLQPFTLINCYRISCTWQDPALHVLLFRDVYKVKWSLGTT